MLSDFAKRVWAALWEVEPISNAGGAVKCCHGCFRSFTAEEWSELKLTASSEDGVEARQCRCGQRLEIDAVKGLAKGEVLRVHTQ